MIRYVLSIEIEPSFDLTSKNSKLCKINVTQGLSLNWSEIADLKISKMKKETLKRLSNKGERKKI